MLKVAETHSGQEPNESTGIPKLIAPTPMSSQAPAISAIRSATKLQPALRKDPPSARIARTKVRTD